MLPEIVAQKSENQIASDVSDLFNEYQIELAKISELGKLLKNFEGPFQYFIKGNKLHSSYTRHMDPDLAVKALNSEYWDRAIKKTDMLDYMSAQERSEWHNMISEFKTPEFSAKNLYATLDQFIKNKDQLLAKKVDGIFRSLSGHHVTNNPMAFSKKMIISNALDSFGSPNYRTCETLDDLRLIVAKYMGRDTDDYDPRTRSTLRITEFGQEVKIDGGALTLKIFKVGTIHIQVHPEIAIYLNDVLSNLYPAVIASSKGRPSKAKKAYDKPLQKNFLSDEVLRILMDISEYRNRSIYTKNQVVKEILLYLGAIEESGTFHIPEESIAGLNEIIRMGCYPEKKSNQFYPTKSALASMVISKLGYIESWDRVLEPSAGQGGLSDRLPKKRTTCVEIDPVNCSILKEKGFSVVEGDFLSQSFERKFQKIAMNPPFSDGRALQHLNKAIELLDDGGTLVAILPCSLVGKVDVSGAAIEWSEPIEGQFDDTNVRVTVLTINK